MLQAALVVALLMVMRQPAAIPVVQEAPQHQVLAVQVARVLQEQVLADPQLAASVALVEYKLQLAALAEKGATVKAT